MWAHTLSFIFWPSSMQADDADRLNDCQLMYNKGKQLKFTSNTENVFFLALGRNLIYMPKTLLELLN